jgi:hypothetical protein
MENAGVKAHKGFMNLQSHLFKRDLLKRDIDVSGTVSFAIVTLSPYK